MNHHRRHDWSCITASSHRLATFDWKCVNAASPLLHTSHQPFRAIDQDVHRDDTYHQHAIHYDVIAVYMCVILVLELNSCPSHFVSPCAFGLFV